MGKKSYNASVVSVPAHPTYDIWAYGVVLYEGIAGLPLGPYACRGKRPMSTAEVSKIGMWDENSLRKALRHIPDDDNGAARHLIRFILHPDPKKRASSMRQVLEHPYFTAVQGSDIIHRQDHQSQMEELQQPSTDGFHPFPTDNDAVSSSNVSRKQPSSSHGRQQYQQQPDVQKTNSGSTDYSIENRENGVRSSGESVSESVKSSRSFGGFRKLKNTFRSSNKQQF